MSTLLRYACIAFIFVSEIALSSTSNKLCSNALNPDLNNDGIVNYKDLWIVGHSFGNLPTSPHFIALADINCDRQVNNIDWQYVWNKKGAKYQRRQVVHSHIWINGPDKTYVGNTTKIQRRIDLSSDKTFSIELTEKITPDNGLGLTNPLSIIHANAIDIGIGGEHGFGTSEPALIKPKIPGDYEMSIHIYIPETGKSILEKQKITVLAQKKAQLSIDLSLTKKKSYIHDSIVYGKVNVYGDDAEDVKNIVIIDNETGASYPIRQNHKKEIPVSCDFYMKKQCNSYHALVETPYDFVSSKTVKICNTNNKHPVYIPPDLHQHYCQISHNVIVALAIDKVPESRLNEILQEAGGRVALESKVDDLTIYFIVPTNLQTSDDWLKIFNYLSMSGEFYNIRGYPESQGLGWCEKDYSGIELLFNTQNMQLLSIN